MLGKKGRRNQWDLRNKAMWKILYDFPYLWAIRNRWSAHKPEIVKVSQDMQDLKLALSQQSMTTHFTFWAFTTQACEIMNEYIREIDRSEDDTWAEAIAKQRPGHLTLTRHLLLVESSDSDHATSNIIIFRNPDESWLDDVIETVIQLQERLPKDSEVVLM